MMSPIEAILNQIDSARINSLLIEAVNHYSPSYAEGPVIAVFVEALERAGVPYRKQRVPASPGDGQRANLLIEIGPMPPELMLVGHVDTIPFWGDDEDDHASMLEGDVLWGLGTADMKSGCVAMVEAVSAAVQAGVTFERGLCLALVVGEEDYGDGSEALLEHMTAPLTIIGEPTGLIPCTEHYAYLESRLMSTGTRAHAALPDIGANAIHAMLSWILQILEQATELPFADQIAFNPREITGGGSLFVIAERCEALLDMHLGPAVDHKLVIELIETARLKALESHQACTLDHEELYFAPGYSVSSENPRLAPVIRAFESLEMGWNPVAFRSHSDGNLFYQKGVIPIVCGPGQLEVAHTRHEHVHLSEVERAARLYASIIYETCVAKA
ncbi:MAG: M20/M25/M40 family metallo-hydrolase [Bradymonadaceae bacterium]|nr:M20/M25/M40 family metallo-hydrolase [Lujinxingiaceae bacterium]